MLEVERLLRATMVSVAVEDPHDCRRAVVHRPIFAELNSRFDAGFDPSRSISADAHELTTPAWALLIARSGGRPVGCGAAKFTAPHRRS